MTGHQFRVEPKQGTASEWAAENTVLLSGEEGYETDTKKTKRGDGVTRYNLLPYEPSENDINIALAQAHAYTDDQIATLGGGSTPPDFNLIFENALV